MARLLVSPEEHPEHSAAAQYGIREVAGIHMPGTVCGAARRKEMLPNNMPQKG